MKAVRCLALVVLVTTSLTWGTYTGAAQDVSTGPSPLTQNRTTSEWMRGSTSMEAAPTQFRALGIRRTHAGVTIDGILLDDRGNACPAGTEGGS